MPAILEPLLKFLTVLAAAGLGFYWLVKSQLRSGKRTEQLKQAKAGDNAQTRQHKTLESRRGRDLLDDLKRVRNDSRKRGTPPL